MSRKKGHQQNNDKDKGSRTVSVKDFDDYKKFTACKERLMEAFLDMEECWESHITFLREEMNDEYAGEELDKVIGHLRDIFAVTFFGKVKNKKRSIYHKSNDSWKVHICPKIAKPKIASFDFEEISTEII